MKVKAKAAAKPGTLSAKLKASAKPAPAKSTAVVSSPPPLASRPGSKTQACLDLLARRNTSGGPR